MLVCIMESILGVVQSPVFVGVMMLFGIIALVRLVFMRDPSLRRVYGHDRRKSRKPMSSVPFYDCDGVLVSEDRRKVPDRRQTRLSGLKYRAEKLERPRSHSGAL